MISREFTYYYTHEEASNKFCGADKSCKGRDCMFFIPRRDGSTLQFKCRKTGEYAYGYTDEDIFKFLNQRHSDLTIEEFREKYDFVLMCYCAKALVNEFNRR